MAKDLTKKEREALRASLRTFDTHVISKFWQVRVIPVWSNPEKFELRFVLNGITYGYKNYFDDPTLAVAVGRNYLEYAYKNKSLYEKVA